MVSADRPGPTQTRIGYTLLTLKKRYPIVGETFLQTARHSGESLGGRPVGQEE
jgi:hypothetical protein